MKKFLLLMIILLQSCDMKKNEIIEPRAEKINKIMTMHNHERIDEFYWLNERGNPKVIDYLNSENDYRNSYMEDYKGLENELFEEIKSRIKEDDSSVPYLDNGYYYYTRFEKGKQYPIYCRKKDNLKNNIRNRSTSSNIFIEDLEKGTIRKLTTSEGKEKLT